jgi:hypothetical protein
MKTHFEVAGEGYTMGRGELSEPLPIRPKVTRWLGTAISMVGAKRDANLHGTINDGHFDARRISAI